MKNVSKIILVVASIVALSGRARAKPAGLLEVLTGFSAKETCSCAFVVEQTDDYCKDFGTIEGYDVTIEIDRTAKTVTSQVVGTKRTARASEGTGCVLDPLP